jgi:hypothetical protein
MRRRKMQFTLKNNLGSGESITVVHFNATAPLNGGQGQQQSPLSPALAGGKQTVIPLPDLGICYMGVTYISANGLPPTTKWRPAPVSDGATVTLMLIGVNTEPILI